MKQISRPTEATDIDKRYDREVEPVNKLLALQDELDKTKKALRDTADGRPSEWAYVQLKNSFDDLEKANEVLRGLVIAAVDRSDALANALEGALNICDGEGLGIQEWFDLLENYRISK